MTMLITPPLADIQTQLDDTQTLLASHIDNIHTYSFQIMIYLLDA